MQKDSLEDHIPYKQQLYKEEEMKKRAESFYEYMDFFIKPVCIYYYINCYTLLFFHSPS